MEAGPALLPTCLPQPPVVREEVKTDCAVARQADGEGLGQDQEEAVRNVEFELTTGADLTLTPHPQEGETMGPDLERSDLPRQVGELRGLQIAERLEGPRTLHEALDLKHAVTLPQSPQLRNGS